MARRKGKPAKILDYHEGLSLNQARIILREFGLESTSDDFVQWICGQTCPVIERYNQRDGKREQTGGIYEYDLFRWIEGKKNGRTAVWD